MCKTCPEIWMWPFSSYLLPASENAKGKKVSSVIFGRQFCLGMSPPQIWALIKKKVFLDQNLLKYLNSPF